ncbi:riboflavin synthase [uncultured Dietzia sp.]|uniref:riboflavin synthase n=1 Tax=uncultured Dietzia sp. TaxID=395519 RepID=UPI0025F3E56C|nr:riboflavin synthase [uncultured Dietzia sp.]
MFTGIVEELGTLESVERMGDSARLRILGPVVTSDAGHGDSIAVNGVCLTVTEHTPGETFDADVMAETLDRTALGTLAPGDRVNLERAMRADARFGGHIVQGHVDGTGELLGRVEHEHWQVVRFSLPAALAKYVVEKGSMTVSGTSLTVSAVSDAGATEPWFEVSLIPTTLEATVLGALAAGDTVNLEVDVLAKYVERLLGGRGGGAG